MFIKHIFTKTRKNQRDKAPVNKLLRDDFPGRLAGRFTVHRGEIILIIVSMLIIGIAIGCFFSSLIRHH